MKKHLYSKLAAFLMTAFVLMGMIAIPSSAATATSRTPITAYTRSTGHVSTYWSANGRYAGYIDGRTDRCSILAVYSNGWCKVRYPVSRGTKTAYTKTSNFFINTSFSGATVRSGISRTVYKRSDMSQSIGSVYASDYVTVVGTSNGNTQVIYPISGGYKLGFIRGKISSGANSSPVRINSGYYYIKSALNTNLVVDVWNISTSDSANVALCRYNGGNNQIFYFSRLSDGNYRITAKHSGKVLDVRGGSRFNGANVIQYHVNSGYSPNQEWTLYRSGSGYRIESAGVRYSLDVTGGKAYDGNNSQVWENNGTDSQKFYLVSASGNQGGSSSSSSSGSSSETAKRNSAVSYMKQMATVQWTPSVSFRHWSYGKRGGNNFIWKAGRTYYGIPYSQSSRYTNLESFKRMLSGSRYTGPARQGSYKGSDCSSAVCYAYNHVNASFPVSGMSTSTLFPCHGRVAAVGGYGYQNYSQSRTICQRNGSSAMKNSYRSLQAGDLVVNNGHVMMVTGRYGNGVYVTHQTTLNRAGNSSWRVNEACSFDYLYRNNYIGVTMKNW